MIGSNANIVALGLLEKECDVKITFFYWLKIGFTIGMRSMIMGALSIFWFPHFQ